MPFLRTPSGWIWKDISKTATNKKNTAAKKNPFDVYEINKKPNPKCPRGQVYNIIEKRCKKYPVSLKNMTRKLRTGLSELDEKYYDDTTDEMFLRLVPEQMIRTGYKRTVGSHDVVLTPEFMQALDRHLSRERPEFRNFYMKRMRSAAMVVKERLGLAIHPIYNELKTADYVRVVPHLLLTDLARRLDDFRHVYLEEFEHLDLALSAVPRFRRFLAKHLRQLRRLQAKYGDFAQNVLNKLERSPHYRKHYRST